MPELPEVETTCQGLARALTGLRIKAAHVHRPDLRFPLPDNLSARLRGRRVLKVERRAKYILIHLDRGETLVFHLGMSGRMVMARGHAKAGLHDHLVFEFSNGAVLRFNDPRRFGVCDLIADEALSNHKLFRHLGVEPLGRALSKAVLEAKFRAKKTALKVALLDQRLIVGIGNIYASEALYRAGIHPARPAGTVSSEEIARLVPAIKKVLQTAIAAGGSSLRDYVQADGELGHFQKRFAVYDREGTVCPDCRRAGRQKPCVRRLAQAGRSTFFCAVTQK
ncbi:MAG: bifunctional DNA-formamidopyrimidine glycosylase/DNA-(apurinic or apyrimidinic site) lyase [Pseudomonadota bacterium]|nr:bifunctional DNA-formamidopyrimidine glycosylase/DNA-(apurinic or apyrimidinic site) lyase [Pseudomonadota bacterium]